MEENFVVELCTSPEDHARSFQQICAEVLARSEFVDCSLCCSDGLVQAHRIILASASSYMHNLLSTIPWPTPCSHPMLFFKSFTVEEIKLAIEFIYTGKVQVTRNKLPKLMNISNDLGCTSLSKAIEKAIESCGVELFRRRINQSQLSTSNKTAPNLRVLAFTNSSQLSKNDACESETPSFFNNPRQNESVTTYSDHVDVTAALTDTDTSDGNFFSSDVKIEPVEDIMNEEIDLCSPSPAPQSILRSTLTPPPLKRGNPHLLVSSAQKIQKVSHYSVNSNKSLKPVTRLDANRTLEVQVSHMESEEYIGVSETDEQEDSSGIIDTDGFSHMDEDADGEMPISVVDLKSLAEPKITSTVSHKDTVFGLGLGSLQTTPVNNNEEVLPANCPWCFQVFTSITLLQRHIKTHVGNYKPYACDYCQATFARSAHLKRHIRTHTGEKPFVCAICQKAFSRQDKLKIHLERHLQGQQTKSEGDNHSLTGVSTNQSYSRPVPKSLSVPGNFSSVTGSEFINNSGSAASSNYQLLINTATGSRSWLVRPDGETYVKISEMPENNMTITSGAISPSTTITPVCSSRSDSTFTAVNQLEINNC